MDVAARDAAFLLSAAGGRALEAARAVRGEDALARRRALEERFPGGEARAALAMDDLRARAAGKTPLADRLFFTRDALEQATPAVVAEDRAMRFRGIEVVADLGSGVGLDAVAIARAGPRVRAVERNAVRAAFLRRNVVEAGVADRVEVIESDFLPDPPRADAAFCDPDRRPAGRRTRDPYAFDPPASAWSRLAAAYGHLLLKLAPVPPREVLGEPLEFVSLDGEMKETRLGYGRLAIGPRRRALLLPSRTTIEGAGADWPPARRPRPGDVLLDPDPAVVLAGLVGDAALGAGASPVHPRIAYLLAAAPAPWARAVVIDEVLPPATRALQAALDRADVGSLTIRMRGVEGGPERWRARLRPRGTQARTLVLTRGPDDRYVALLGREVAS